MTLWVPALKDVLTLKETEARGHRDPPSMTGLAQVGLTWHSEGGSVGGGGRLGLENQWGHQGRAVSAVSVLSCEVPRIM